MLAVVFTKEDKIDLRMLGFFFNIFHNVGFPFALVGIPIVEIKTHNVEQ